MTKTTTVTYRENGDYRHKHSWGPVEIIVSYPETHLEPEALGVCGSGTE
jgi:hypothetical protein